MEKRDWFWAVSGPTEDADGYSGLKSGTRPKFLHIGLKLWELIGTFTLQKEQANEDRTKIIEILLSPSFLRVFVRSLSMQKGVLFEVAKEVKQTLIQLMEKVQVSPDFSIQLL